MPDRESFAQLVRRRRRETGLTQAALGARVGRSRSAVRSWEAGTAAPAESTVVDALAAALTVPRVQLETLIDDRIRESEPDTLQNMWATLRIRAAAAPVTDEAPAAEEQAVQEPVEAPDGEVVAPDEEAPVDEDLEAPEVEAAIADAEAIEVAPVDEDLEAPEVEAAIADAEAIEEAAVDDATPVPDPNTDVVDGESGAGGTTPVLPHEAASVPAAAPAGSVVEAAVTQPIRRVPSPSDRPAAGRGVERPPARPPVRIMREPTFPPAAVSYMEDPEERSYYSRRMVGTLGAILLLLLLLYWAGAQLGDAIGSVLDTF